MERAYFLISPFNNKKEVNKEMVLTENNLKVILSVMRTDDIDVTTEAWELIKERILFLAEPFFKGDD